MESNSKQPLKDIECVVCRRKTTNGKFIQNRTGITKNLSVLLEKYGGMVVRKGFMCMKCVRQLLGIQKRVQKFRAICQKSPHYVVTHRLVRVPPPIGNEVILDATPMKLVPINKAVPKVSSSLNGLVNVKLTKEMTPQGPKPALVFEGPRGTFPKVPSSLKSRVTKEMMPQGHDPALAFQGSPLASVVNLPEGSMIGVPVKQQHHQFKKESPSITSTKSKSNLSPGCGPQILMPVHVFPNQPAPRSTGSKSNISTGAPQILIPVFPNPPVLEHKIPPLGNQMQTSFHFGQAPAVPVGSYSPLKQCRLIAPKKTLSTIPQPANTDGTAKQVSNKESTMAKTAKESKTSQDTEPETEVKEPALYSFSDDHCYPLKEKTVNEILSRHANEWLQYRSNRKTEYLGSEDIKVVVSKAVEGSVEKLAEAAMRIPGLRRRMMAHLMSDLDKAFDQISKRKIGTISCLKPVGYENCTVFDWDPVILEMNMVVPELLQICLASTNRASYLEKNMDKALRETLPKIGLVFAIFAQGRIRELNKVQRTMALLLRRSGCDGKQIYGKLNHLGLCTSYTQMLTHVQGIVEEKRAARLRRKQENKNESSDDDDDDIGGGGIGDTSAPGLATLSSEGQAAASTSVATVSRFGGAKKIFLVPKPKVGAI